MLKKLYFLLLLSLVFVQGKDLTALIDELPASYNEVIDHKYLGASLDGNLPSAPKDLDMHMKSFFERMPSKAQKLTTDFGYLQVLGLTSMVVLGLLPRETSNWDTGGVFKKGLFQNWLENIQITPVYDKDDWAVNYIGHPVGGAFYYTLARNEGFNSAESAFFTFMVSTFYWEYGFEAVFETPSIQDLIVTPLLGSLFGELFYQLQLKIKANEGKAFGSKRLGNFFMIFFDPEGTLADFLRGYFHKHDIAVDFAIVNSFSSYYSFNYEKRDITGLPPVFEEYYIGFTLSVAF